MKHSFIVDVPRLFIVVGIHFWVQFDAGNCADVVVRVLLRQDHARDHNLLLFFNDILVGRTEIGFEPLENLLWLGLFLLFAFGCLLVSFRLAVFFVFQAHSKI